MAVKIAAQFTKDNRGLNGLNTIADELVADDANSDEVRYLIAKYHVRRVTEERDEGGVLVPTVNLDHIEPIIVKADATKVAKLLEQAYGQRQLKETAARGQEDLFSDGDE